MAKTVGTNQEVVESYVRKGTVVRNHNNTLFIADNILYSYGTHFPLAVPIRHFEGSKCYLLNGDLWSSTTSHHQWHLRYELQKTYHDYTTVSFSALRSIIDRLEIPCPNETSWPYIITLIDKTEPASETTRVPAIYKPDGQLDRKHPSLLQVQKDLRKKFTSVQTYLVTRERTDGSYYKEWKVTGHTAESAIIRIQGPINPKLRPDSRSYYVLLGFDDRSYFASVLPYPVASVAEAFSALKPYAVREAEKLGLTVLRQGEWFFIKVAEKGEAYKRLGIPDRAFRMRPLPHHPAGNRHWCRLVEHKDEFGLVRYYCTGLVRHWDRWGRSTREHSSLSLSDGYYLAVKNQEVISASASMRVD